MTTTFGDEGTGISSVLLPILTKMSTHRKMGSFDAARESWTSYAERLEFYFAANGVTDADTKKAIFVTVVGTQSYSLLKSLLQPQTPQTATLTEMKAALEKHFCPKPCIVQRYRFHTRIRKTTESVATYVAELRAIGEHCAFGDTLEDMIRDRLVCGINNPRIQRQLLQEPDLSYDKAFEKAQSMETATQDVVNMSTENKLAPVHNIRNKSGASKHADTTSFARVECHRCGGNHYATKCKFIDADCRKCGKKGHLARVCRSIATSKKPQMGKSSPLQSRTLPAKPHFPTHNLDLEPHPLPPPSPDSDYSLFTFPSKSKPIVITVQVNNATLPMELDTGASLSLISEATYKALSLPALSHTDIILSTYTGEKISPLGCIDVKVMYQSQEATLPLLVVAGEGPNLIGRNWLDYLKLDWSDIKTQFFFFSRYSVGQTCRGVSSTLRKTP